MGDLLGRKITIINELKQEKIINLKKQIRIAYYFNIKAEFFDLKGRRLVIYQNIGIIKRRTDKFIAT